MISTLLMARVTLWLLPLLVPDRGSGGIRSTGRLSPAPLPGLTQRETEVLYLLAEGLSNPQIGKRLRISQHTVRAHVYSIYSKLNVNGRVSAAMLVIS
jgi:DNA-binding NarL/FixJ family response regulator